MRKNWQQVGKSLLLVAALSLLVGCASKADICARWSAGQMEATEAAEKLGIKAKGQDPKDYVVD